MVALFLLSTSVYRCDARSTTSGPSEAQDLFSRELIREEVRRAMAELHPDFVPSSVILEVCALSDVDTFGDIPSLTQQFPSSSDESGKRAVAT